jgi:O-antigen/teichoic acid export membrane protein
VAGYVIVFGIIELLSTPLLVTVFPLMSRLHDREDRDLFNLMLEKLSFFNLLLSVPIAIFTSLLAVPLSILIFGPGFAGTAAALRIMIWYTVVAMIVNVFSRALAVQNRQRRLLAVRVIGLVLSIALNLILLPRLGISGTALAMAIAELVVLVLILRSLSLPGMWWQKMTAHVWRLTLPCAVLAAATLLLRSVSPVLAVLVGLPAFAGVLILSGAVTEADRALIWGLAATFPAGARLARYWKR